MLVFSLMILCLFFAIRYGRNQQADQNALNRKWNCGKCFPRFESANERFDIIYDSFLEEQFRTTQLVFDLLRDIHGLTYYRITEWPRTMAAFSLDQLPVLAHERVRNLDVKTLAAFRE